MVSNFFAVEISSQDESGEYGVKVKECTCMNALSGALCMFSSCVPNLRRTLAEVVMEVMENEEPRSVVLKGIGCVEDEFYDAAAKVVRAWDALTKTREQETGPSAGG